jgi:hypothetical protein
MAVLNCDLNEPRLVRALCFLNDDFFRQFVYSLVIEKRKKNLRSISTLLQAIFDNNYVKLRPKVSDIELSRP